MDFTCRLVGISGIYFKGFWKQKFPPASTTKAEFFIDDTRTIQVDMMELTLKTPYAHMKEFDAQVFSLPFRGDKLLLLVFVPEKKLGLGKIEEALRLKKIHPAGILSKLKPTDIHLKLPRFKIESTVQLREPFKKVRLTVLPLKIKKIIIIKN